MGSKVQGKIILIDTTSDGGFISYIGFTSRAEAKRYASALDWFYTDDYDPQGKPPVYTDQDLFEKDWVIVEAIKVDWEQFGK